MKYRIKERLLESDFSKFISVEIKKGLFHPWLTGKFFLFGKGEFLKTKAEALKEADKWIKKHKKVDFKDKILKVIK